MVIISTDVIKKLIQVGKANQPLDQSTDAVLRSLKKYDFINRLAPEYWYKVARLMQVDGLIGLIRGLTIAELRHKWIGGSVSAVIWTFRELQRRDPAIADEVADWVLANTNNTYLPYGSQNFFARSLSEYKTAKALHEQMICYGLKEKAESEAKATIERHIRKKQKERSAQNRNSPERHKIIEQLSSLPLSERMEIIASDLVHAINFYPTSWADAADTQLIRDLSPSVRIALLTKLKGKQRGPWAKFKKRLWGVESPHWNRKPWFR